MKTYYSAQEIEDLARQGVRELVVDDNVVLTDLARLMAEQMGLRLVTARSALPAQAPASAAVAPRPVAAQVAAVPLPAKPKGCQRGAVAPAVHGQALLAAPAGSGGADGHLVDDLVGLVRQMSKR